MLLLIQLARFMAFRTFSIYSLGIISLLSVILVLPSTPLWAQSSQDITISELEKAPTLEELVHPSLVNPSLANPARLTDTPKDRFVRFLKSYHEPKRATLGPSPADRPATHEPHQQPRETVRPEQNTASNTQQVRTPSPNPKTSKIVPEKSEPLSAQITTEMPFTGPLIFKTKRLPFYVTALDYLALRQSETAPRLELIYDWKKKNTKTGDVIKTIETRILIGTDYAAMQTIDGMRLYDFKLNRRLIITETGKDLQFVNSSLYPLVLKKVETIKRATKNGTRAALKISETRDLNVFWMESALGYSARSDIADLSIAIDGADLKANFKNETVFKSRFLGPEIPSEAHKKNLIALMHYEMDIHPEILEVFTSQSHTPLSLSYITRGPAFLDGITSLWTLRQNDVITSLFPLPSNAHSTLEIPPLQPLPFVIHQAATSKALTGPKTDTDLKKQALAFEAAALKSETPDEDLNLTRAFLIWQSLAERNGGCPVAKACKSLDRLKGLTPKKPKLNLVTKAFRPTKNRLPLAQAGLIQSLTSLSDKTEMPAILRRKTAELRTQMSPKIAKSTGVSDINPGALLETALIQNPYDPKTYQLLGQIYSARGDFTKSWDIRDALLVLPDLPKTISGPTLKAEKTLRNAAPAYFPHPYTSGP